MPKNVKVNVEYLTRVEGHGNIVVDVQDGKLKECRLDIIESPRFFEAMLRGRSIFEAQHITSRICGICACAHSLVSLQAAEDALGVKPSPQTTKLRKLLLHQELLDSHILHIYILVLPDLMKVKSFVPLLETHEKVVRRALKMKKCVNDVCEIIAGRHIHPISTVIGGFTKLPSKEDLKKILSMLKDLKLDIDATVELFKGIKFPEFERETEYVALVSDDDEYPLLEGDIGSTDGVRKHKHKYKEITNEFVVPHSTAKHTKLSRESYMVGALARLNLNFDKLLPRAKEVARELGFSVPCHNPYLNTVAQLIECVHCVDESISIVEEFLENGIDYSEQVVVGLNENSVVKVKAGWGVGAVEAPRGVLFHNYETDQDGRIINANCIIPTNQNLNNIEHDMKKLVPEILDKSEEEITLLLEMLVRAYDPCISCSTHFLDVEFVGRKS